MRMRLDTAKKQFASHKTLPEWLAILIIAVLIGLYFGARASYKGVPQGKLISNADPTEFIAENAFNHIRNLSVDIGVRYGGTYQSEVLTVKFLLDTLKELAKEAHPEVKVEISHQITTDVYYRDVDFYTDVNTFRGLQNVVAKIEGSEASNDYILLNAHFDTVSGSPGAGDDGTMVGILLEVFRVMVQQSNLRNPIVFLFNGCEENELQGSFSFTTHLWWKNVKIALNFDAAGLGGKEIVFQVAAEHPWLIRKYGDVVPSPFASTIGQELFEAGVIPSDTDFRIFRTFGDRMPAIDFAQISQGQVYHSKEDSFDKIDMGALQHTGNNVRALLEELSGNTNLTFVNDLADTEPEAIFQDFMGLFLINYNETVGIWINSIIFVAVFIATTWTTIWNFKYGRLSTAKVICEYFIALGIQFLALILSFCAAAFAAFFMDALGRSMSYYTSNWLIFGLFFCPAFLFLAGIPYGFIKFRKRTEIFTVSFLVQLQVFALSHILAILMIVLTAMGIKSAFVLVVCLLFFTFTTLVNNVFKLTLCGNRWLYLHMAGQIIPTTLYFYLAGVAFEVLTPSVTRVADGQSSNPDMIIALLAALLGYLSTGFWAPLLSLFRRMEYILGGFLAVFIIFIIIGFTPVGFPYKDGYSPQRWVIVNAERVFFNIEGQVRKSDSGYYIQTIDRHGVESVEDIVPEVKQGVNILPDCDIELFCGIPYLLPYSHANRKHALWLQHNRPIYRLKPVFEFLGKMERNSTIHRYSFKFAGPSRMSVQISPLQDVKIINWSLMDYIPIPKYRWKERDVFFINYVHGLQEYDWVDFEFYMDLDVSMNPTRSYTFDIAFAAQFMESPEINDNEFREFLEKFPGWTFVQSWNSYYENWQMK